MINIHPSAVIHPSAKIHNSVEINAYAIIGADVEIGEGTIIDSHTVIQGPTKIGTNNHIYSFASIGGDPQDITYEDDQESNLIIGDNNIIREFCTINRGTPKDRSITRIGSNNMLMAYVHIAHDCQLGNHIIMANNASLAGHVKVYDWAILGGFTLVKQFCRIGAHTYMGMGCHINKDIPPYMVVTCTGNRAIVRAVNIEGMKRRGFSRIAIGSIRQAFLTVYMHNQGKLLGQKLTELEYLEADSLEVVQFIGFIRSSTCGIMRGPVY
ncbi:MAG: acyl-ACP--UDP-N-acetylglucosamine O-acyltransferase [Gammaproteobacteria bacterium]|nr:acyl-ACP--UDP-N-acetylglucosamine O-acyltransferase [Gammaproteobacteria bacterium]